MKAHPEENMYAVFQQVAGDGDRIYFDFEGVEYSGLVARNVQPVPGRCHYCSSTQHIRALSLKVEELAYDHGGEVPEKERTKVVAHLLTKLFHLRKACPNHADQFKAEYWDAHDSLQDKK